MRRVVLYTIGQGTPLFERFGHTLLCVQHVGAPDESGLCTDYGVSNASSLFNLAWGTLRGREMFVATAVPENVALSLFRGQGRAIDRQVLPLDDAQADHLADMLQRQVESGWSYAYHPRTSNCASHPRDLIGIASGGKLRIESEIHGIEPHPDMAHYRDQFEAGLSGHLGELMVAAFVTGTSADGKPNAWDAMYLPEALRDGVATYLGASTESVATRVDRPLPTSPSIGRGAIVVLAFALYALASRMHRLHFARFVVAFMLGVPALVMDFFALVSSYPEFIQNWVTALVWPSDLVLPWLRGRALTIYATVRVAVAAAIALGELVGVISQPILPIAAYVALPMLGVLAAQRTRRTAVVPAQRPVAA